MFVVLVYDVNVKRITHVHKVCRRYLYWVQNSVFEGEITEEKLRELVKELRKIIDEEEDSLMIFKFRFKNMVRRTIVGKDKSDGGSDYIV